MIRSLISRLKGYGDKGRFVIPDLRIKVPLYSVKEAGAQAVVDRPNCAAFVQWKNHVAIVDHVQQAFGNLKKAVPGATVAYIEQPDADRLVLLCTKKQIGHIKLADGRNRLYDAAWNDVSCMQEGEYVVYTCVDGKRSDPSVTDVTLTYWSTVRGKIGK